MIDQDTRELLERILELLKNTREDLNHLGITDVVRLANMQAAIVEHLFLKEMAEREQ